jgi:hypothetical protein
MALDPATSASSPLTARRQRALCHESLFCDLGHWGYPDGHLLSAHIRKRKKRKLAGLLKQITDPHVTYLCLIFGSVWIVRTHCADALRPHLAHLSVKSHPPFSLLLSLLPPSPPLSLSSCNELAGLDPELRPSPPNLRPPSPKIRPTLPPRVVELLGHLPSRCPRLGRHCQHRNRAGRSRPKR